MMKEAHIKGRDDIWSREPLFCFLAATCLCRPIPIHSWWPFEIASCPSCESALPSVAAMDTRRLKDGEILKWKSGFLSSKWKSYYCVLFSDSRLCWYDDKVCLPLPFECAE